MVIILTGFKQSGKDTVANYLQSNFGFNKIALADPIRNLAEIYNPYICIFKFWFFRKYKKLNDLLKKYDWDYIKEKYPESREWLIKIGTEGGRDIWGEDCWTNKAKEILNSGENYVISDGRFDSEITDFREFNPLVIRILNPNTKVGSHRTEKGVSENLIHYTINNNASFSELYMKIDNIMHAENITKIKN